MKTNQVIKLSIISAFGVIFTSSVMANTYGPSKEILQKSQQVKPNKQAYPGCDMRKKPGKTNYPCPVFKGKNKQSTPAVKANSQGQF